MLTWIIRLSVVAPRWSLYHAIDHSICSYAPHVSLQHHLFSLGAMDFICPMKDPTYFLATRFSRVSSQKVGVEKRCSRRLALFLDNEDLEGFGMDWWPPSRGEEKAGLQSIEAGQHLYLCPMARKTGLTEIGPPCLNDRKEERVMVYCSYQWCFHLCESWQHSELLQRGESIKQDQLQIILGSIYLWPNLNPFQLPYIFIGYGGNC